MSLRLLIILVALVLIIGILPYLLHEASQPGTFTVSTMGTTLTWTDGPDVELSDASLHKLTSEAEMLARQALGGEIVPMRIRSIGKRHVEINYTGTHVLPDDLKARVEAYIQKRLPELAREQGGS